MELGGGLQIRSSIARTPVVLTTEDCIGVGGEQRLLARSSVRNPHLVLCVKAHIGDTTTEWTPVLELVLALGSGDCAAPWDLLEIAGRTRRTWDGWELWVRVSASVDHGTGEGVFIISQQLQFL